MAVLIHALGLACALVGLALIACSCFVDRWSVWCALVVVGSVLLWSPLLWAL